MKLQRIAVVSLAVIFAACPTEREAAIGVTVSIEPGIISTHVVVSATGGEVTKKTRCIPIAGQRFLDVGVAQGNLPATVSLSAEGFSDAECSRATAPAEISGAVERRFRKGLIIDAPLVLRAMVSTIETSCGNGVDDDADGQLDCADLDCTDRSCSTGNACVTGQTCSNGNCQGGQQVTCDAPPSGCFMASGLCVVDAGCRYLAMAGNTCDDGSDCTMADRCDTMGACVGQAQQCSTPPPGQCWAMAGVCSADGGCTYEPSIGATCNDQENCTINDQCDGDAGCKGTRVTCAPRECAIPSGACSGDGGCLYSPIDAGLACADGGACNVQGGCLPPFPFVPSNVAINDIPNPSSGKVTFNCGTTVIDTGASGTPSVTNYCAGQPMFGSASITQSGGIATVVLAFDDLEVAGNGTLSIIGARPAIIVSMKDISVLGAIQVGAGAQPCTGAGAGGAGGGVVYKSGGGGGGFATAGGAGGSVNLGAAGGAAGAVNLGTALRGGCPGGLGGGSSARASAGGGALQLVARQNISIAGVIDAPGRGGEGGGFSNGGNGGGSGGELLLEAMQVIASGGGLTCNGGGGGEAGTMNAGQPGQLSGTPATGGTDSFGGGAGGSGAAGSTAANPGEGSSAVSGGGGGGGGVGRIRINVTNGCNIGPQVTISPAATSNRPDAGCP
jgi:hypothetical protein